MLQSPVKRVQRQQRLSESPLLDTQNAITSLPTQKRSYRRQQHRRQLSVPDESLLLKSSMGPKMMSFDMDGSAVNMNGNVIMNGTFNIFTVTEQPSLSSQPRQGYTPVPHQTQYSSFPYPRPHNQHVRKGSMDSVQPKRRGSLLNPNMRPLAPAGRLDDAANMIAQDIYAHNEHGMPTRAHTTPLMSISTFDLAPIPHAGHYVNLSSLAMGSPDTELDEHSFYTHSPISMSPGFPPHDVQQHLAMFDTSMASANDLTSSPVLPAQNPIHARPLLAPAPVPTETAPLERGDVLSGITMEEIASFIDGPEPSDGKWVCLYEGCAKRFGRKENIKSHVQTHLGDRQFKCVVCKKCFVRQHDLKRHSKIHTGVKPYPCLCGNSFARHDALTRHRQRGMCIGAFEGVVRKEVKRGRPRKKPLPKEDNQSGITSSGASDTSSAESTGADETTSTSPTPSAEEDSPGGIPDMGSSDEYSPPTSPGYDVESFTITDKSSFEEFGHGQYMTRDSPDYTTHPNLRKPQSTYSSPGEFGASVELGMFTQEMLNLTALERDPTILNFEEGYIKSELLDASDTAFMECNYSI